MLPKDETPLLGLDQGQGATRSEACAVRFPSGGRRRRRGAPTHPLSAPPAPLCPARNHSRHLLVPLPCQPRLHPTSLQPTLARKSHRTITSKANLPHHPTSHSPQMADQLVSEKVATRPIEGGGGGSQTWTWKLAPASLRQVLRASHPAVAQTTRSFRSPCRQARTAQEALDDSGIRGSATAELHVLCATRRKGEEAQLRRRCSIWLAGIVTLTLPHITIRPFLHLPGLPSQTEGEFKRPCRKPSRLGMITDSLPVSLTLRYLPGTNRQSKSLVSSLCPC